MHGGRRGERRAGARRAAAAVPADDHWLGLEFPPDKARQRPAALHRALRDAFRQRRAASAGCCSTSGRRSSPASDRHGHRLSLRPAEQRAAAGDAAGHAEASFAAHGSGPTWSTRSTKRSIWPSSAPSSPRTSSERRTSSFLPATIIAATLTSGLTISANLALNNNADCCRPTDMTAKVLTDNLAEALAKPRDSEHHDVEPARRAAARRRFRPRAARRSPRRALDAVPPVAAGRIPAATMPGRRSSPRST